MTEPTSEPRALASVAYQPTAEQSTDWACRAWQRSPAYRRALIVGTSLFWVLPLGGGLGWLVWRLTGLPWAGIAAAVCVGLLCLRLSRQIFAANFRRRVRAAVDAQSTAGNSTATLELHLHAEGFTVHSTARTTATAIAISWRDVTQVCVVGDDLELRQANSLTMLHGSAIPVAERRREFYALAEHLWQKGRQHAATLAVNSVPGMAQPLASATFDFTVDDLVDVAVRTTTERARVRRLRWAMPAFGVVLIAICGALRPDLPVWPIALVLAPIIAVSVVRCAHLRRSHLRGVYLRAGLGVGGKCTFDLHREELIVVTRTSSGWSKLALPWSDALALREDRGDLEIRYPENHPYRVAVLRGRAFRDAPERRACFALAHELWQAAHASAARAGPANAAG